MSNASELITNPEASREYTLDDVKLLGQNVAESLDEDKAESILTIDLAGKSSMADMMIIASGRSNRHVSALAAHLVKFFKARGKSGLNVQGLPTADWVLIDAGDIIIHLFRPEVREFYKLEKMWA